MPQAVGPPRTAQLDREDEILEAGTTKRGVLGLLPRVRHVAAQVLSRIPESVSERVCERGSVCV